MAKLMFIHHSGLVGGAGVSLINVIKSVSEQHEVFVYVPCEPNDMINLLKQSEKSHGIKVKTYGRRIGAITYYSGGDTLKNVRFWYRISLIFMQWKMWNKLIRECNPDIVIVNSKILCWMSLLREVRKRKSFCFVRETMKGNERSRINKIISKLLSYYKRVVFISEFDAKCEQLDTSQKKVIHNYIEESQFDLTVSRAEASKRLGLREDTFHVLYVGGVSYMKGFDLIVRAVLECGPNVELVVAGNNCKDAMSTKNKRILKYVKEWEGIVEKKDRFEQIHMVGKQKDMSNCYASCDVLVFPMRAAHQSRPAFEAGYFSKPVIITDFDNIAETVKNGDNGYVVQPDSVEEIIASIKKLMTNEKERIKMGEHNRQNTEKMHNKEKNINLISEMIKELYEL